MLFDEGPSAAVPLAPGPFADPGDWAESASPADRAEPAENGPSGELAEPRERAEPRDESHADLLATLENLARVPLREHAEHYQQIHAHLQGRLAEIDSA